MKKILLLLTTLLLSVNCFADEPATQAIQLVVQLQELSGNPTYWMVVQNVDTGEVTPFMYPLNQANDEHLFETTGSNYKILALQIQSQTGVSTPCQLDQKIVENEATRVIISGSLTQTAQLSCNYSYVPALPLNQVTAQEKPSTPVQALAPVEQAAASDTVAPNVNPNNEYGTIINYLEGLKSCKASTYNADINKQNITYNIKGQTTNGCMVDINIKGVTKEPVICHFSKKDVALLTSDKQIGMYQSGKINLDANSVVTKVMSEACK